MANFDPAQRAETWIYQSIGNHPITGKPMWRRLKYNYVAYDGAPERYIEPVNTDAWVNSVGNTSNVINPRTDFGLVEGFEFITTRPEAFGFDDFDASATSLFS